MSFFCTLVFTDLVKADPRRMQKLRFLNPLSKRGRRVVVPIRLLFLLCTLLSFFLSWLFFFGVAAAERGEKPSCIPKKGGEKVHGGIFFILLHSTACCRHSPKVGCKTPLTSRCKISLELTTILEFRETMLSAVLTNTLWAIIRNMANPS